MPVPNDLQSYFAGAARQRQVTQQQRGSRFLKGLGNFGKSALGGVFDIAVSAFNHHLAEKSAKAQYDRQLDFWNKQNAYNTPLSQRKRLEAAGLNPAVLAGDIAGHNTAGMLSSVPGNELAQRGTIDHSSFLNSLQLLGQMESVGAGTDSMKRQIELSYADELVKNNQAYGIELDNREKHELLKWLSSEKRAALEGILAGTAETKARTAGILIDNENKPQVYSDQHRAAEDTHKVVSAEGKHADSKYSAEVLAIKAKALSDQLSAVKQTCESYKIAAESRKITNDDARAQAMHIVDVQLKQLDSLVKEAEAKKIISETQAQEWETYKDKLLTHGPGWSFTEINDFIGAIVTDFLPELIPF